MRPEDRCTRCNGYGARATDVGKAVKCTSCVGTGLRVEQERTARLWARDARP